MSKSFQRDKNSAVLEGKYISVIATEFIIKWDSAKNLLKIYKKHILYSTNGWLLSVSYKINYVKVPIMKRKLLIDGRKKLTDQFLHVFKRKKSSSWFERTIFQDL